ncbi:MAG: glycosyltransferase family 4 protein [Steroidobacteraceae bacterium]
MLPDTSTRIAIITDAWLPQVNGVVTTLRTTVATLKKLGHVVLVIEPGLFKTFPCPSYPEIRLAWFPYRRIDQLLREFRPEAIHISTEGTLGHAARKWCRRNKIPFTTAYHTQYPEYLAARAPIPLKASYAYLRRFHGAASRTMVPTPTLQKQLEANGFTQLVRWSRGVDTELFKPRDKNFLSLARPIWMYVGRVAVEKNIEAFLQLKLPGTKVVVGEGPACSELRRKYATVQFVGYKFGEALAQHVASADVFVFPSRTDTFGLVLLEAMACGVPVAAYPVAGPIDVVAQGVGGVLHANLEQAARTALLLDTEQCRQQALRYSWAHATQQFFNNLHRFDSNLLDTQSRLQHITHSQ